MPKTESPQNQAYYDDFSTGYERERARGYHAMLDELESGIVEPLARGKRVLEAGCGTGLVLSRIAKTAQRAVGIDLSPGMLAKAHQRGLETTLASVTNLPFAEDTFDVTCSFKVLAHIENIQLAMAELLRVTRPGGVVVAEFYNALSLRYLAKRLAGPQPISPGLTEADVFTRWDTPLSVRRYIPAGARLEATRGVRVFTPVAAVHKLPVVGEVMRSAEKLAVCSPLNVAAGFLILVLRKARV